MHKTTICGTDLHILCGSVRTCTAGRILGHEGIGDIVAIGSGVHKFKVGDRILISCITSCGKCSPCVSDKFYGHCEDGGWQLGNTINGMQTEYCRIPHVDCSAYHVPRFDDLDLEDKYVMCSDILPTAYEIGLIDGNIKAGIPSMCIVGAGPVGLAALLVAKAMYSPKRIFVVDTNRFRLDTAMVMGATDSIDNTKGDSVAQIMQATGGKGVDLCIECIGLPVGWYICQDIVKAGGHIAILGVHGEPATLNLERMWYRNFKVCWNILYI